MQMLKQKSRDCMPIWAEFNQLSMKYNAINLNHGSPGLNPPTFLIDNLYKACRDGFNQYTLYNGHPKFREKLAEKYSKHFKQALENCSPETKELNPNKQILVTNGACEGLFSAIHNLIEKGDEVLAF